MIKNLSIIEGAVTEPVELAEQKEWMNISHSDHDPFILRLIKGSRKRVEHYCGISLVPKTITALLYLEDQYELPLGPVVSVSSVHTVASDNTDNPLTDSDYYLSGAGFQLINSYTRGLHKVVYETGYTDVPQDLKEAIMSEVAYRYEHRGDELKGGISEEALSLAFPYKRMRV